MFRPDISLDLVVSATSIGFGLRNLLVNNVLIIPGIIQTGRYVKGVLFSVIVSSMAADFSIIIIRNGPTACPIFPPVIKIDMLALFPRPAKLAACAVACGWNEAIPIPETDNNSTTAEIEGATPSKLIQTDGNKIPTVKK